MKTPEDIRKLLEDATITIELTDPFTDRTYRLNITEPVRKEVLDAFSTLESRLAQVERERDALLREVGISCDYCAYADNPFGEEPCITLEEYELGKLCSGWKWRGVCEENTKEEGK